MRFLRRYFIIVCALVGAAFFADDLYNVSQIPGADPFSTLSVWMIILVPICLGFILATLPQLRRSEDDVDD